MLLSLLLSLGVVAVNLDNPSSYNNNPSDVVVIVENASNLSEEQAMRLTEMVRLYHCGGVATTNSNTYGLTCTLFGHKTIMNTTYVIEHKVRATNPRCLQTLYEVTTCERCDYENIQYVTDSYIPCCP